MGLRMFVEPEANEAKAAIKTDPSAPARSAIRRQRTVRYPPHVRDRPSSRAHPDAVSREIHQRRLLREFIRQRDRERGHTIRQDREREHLILEAEREAERADAERAEASRQQRLVSGRALLRDALSYERPSQRLRVLRDYDDMPDLIAVTETEPSSYAEVLQRPADNEARGQTRVEADSRLRSPPPRYMPTPPYSFEDSSSRSAPSRLTPPSGPADYASRVAPANRFANESMEEYIARVGHISSHQLMLDEVTRTRQEVERTREEVRRTREEVNRTWRDIDTSAYDSLDELPPLRRMGRRHGDRRPLPNSQPLRGQPNIDGLGDRRRSFSPEDDAWDTLLTTITPDERVPSVHSSFTSATASASASVAPNPASSNSYGTLATFPSSASTADLYPNLCDNTDSEDLLTEDESATATMQETNDMSTSRTMANANPSLRPVYSRRYDNGASDRVGQLASLRGWDNEEVDARLDIRTFNASDPDPDVDMTYEDRYRRNRLRHLRATEMGSERSSGVRPARERL